MRGFNKQARHDTLQMQKHALIAEELTDFRVGDRVMTIDGFPGKVSSISFGPFQGTEDYEVVLDHGLGGGTYSPGQLRPITTTSASRIEAAEIVASIPFEAVTDHTANTDYPELENILTERLPNENIKVFASRTAGVNGNLPEGMTIHHEKFDPYDDGSNYHYISAHHKGQEIGALSLRPGGEVDTVGVEDNYQRRGVASALWDHAKKLGLNPYHSDNMTEDGEAWAKHTAANSTAQDDTDDDESDKLDQDQDEASTENSNDPKNDDEAADEDSELDTKPNDSPDVTPPSACSYCGNANFEDPQMTGRGTRIRCSDCGGTMKSWGGKWGDDEPGGNTGPQQAQSQWEPEFPNSSQNQASEQGDYRSGGAGGVVQAPGVNFKASSLQTEAGIVNWIVDKIYDRIEERNQKALLSKDWASPSHDHDFAGPAQSCSQCVAQNSALPDPQSLHPHGLTIQSALNHDDEWGFHLTSSWIDVQAKARKIRRSGGVKIVSASKLYVVGEVQGDRNVYESQLNYVVGTKKVADWACGCKWASYAWGRSPGFQRFEGRLCSHALALQYEAGARGMFGREIGEEAGHGKPVSVQWDKANDTHLLRSSSLIDSDALYPEPDALDLYHPPIYAFATNMVNNGEPLLNILQMLSSFGMSREATRSILQEVWLEPAINWAESHAKRSVAAGWYTDAENDFEGLTEAHIASSYVNEQLFDENAQNRDLSDHDRESDHQTDGKKKHKHRTNDAREHAPNTAHPGWGYGGIGGLLVCPQCMGSGCGHCAGSGQVTQEQASTPTQPLTDQTPDQTQDAGSASTSGGVSASLKTADYSVNDPLSGGGGQGYVVPPQHSNSQNPASTGWATSQDPGDWGRSLISNDFGVTFDASLHTAKSSSPQEGPTVSGVALKAADTGRVLMIQRSMKDESDPAKGTWEFPGGHHEEGDQTSLHAGIREWQEETGQPFPEGGHVTHVHRTGPYNLHTVVIPEESQVKFHEGRSLDNPDDPDGDDHENAAWWEPDHAKKNPALRDELKGHPSWGDIKRAASVKTASNWDMFDNNHSYRAGHQAGGKGDFSQVDEIERWRKPGHPVSDHDADYLLGHQHGLDAARESAEGNHRMKKLFEEAPEYNSVEHQVDMLGHELDRHSSLETDDISLDSVMSVYTTLHDDPEAALPSTDGAEDVQGSILAGNSVDGPHDTDDAQHIVEAFLASKGAAVIANGDKELMAKVAMKDFNHAEQQELINEGMGDRARNFGDLKIAGTHYALIKEEEDDVLWY